MLYITKRLILHWEIIQELEALTKLIAFRIQLKDHKQLMLEVKLDHELIQRDLTLRSVTQGRGMRIT